MQYRGTGQCAEAQANTCLEPWNRPSNLQVSTFQPCEFASLKTVLGEVEEVVVAVVAGAVVVV